MRGIVQLLPFKRAWRSNYIQSTTHTHTHTCTHTSVLELHLLFTYEVPRAHIKSHKSSKALNVQTHRLSLPARVYACVCRLCHAKRLIVNIISYAHLHKRTHTRIKQSTVE